MLPDKLEQPTSVRGAEAHAAVTGWAAKLPNGGCAMDCKSALEEQGVRHGRHMILARVPHALHPLHVVTPNRGFVTLAAVDTGQEWTAAPSTITVMRWVALSMWATTLAEAGDANRHVARAQMAARRTKVAPKLD